MLDLLTLAYAQFVIMLTELQKMLSHELKCLFSKTTTVLAEWTVPKTMDVSLLQFYCNRNKYTVQKHIWGAVNKFPDWIFRARTERSNHTSR